MILNAPALLAFLNDEPGAARVGAALDEAVVSTVNWSEVVQKSLQLDADVVGMLEEFREVGVVFEPFTATQAETAAHLWEAMRPYGFSLADRACLALAIEQLRCLPLTKLGPISISIPMYNCCVESCLFIGEIVEYRLPGRS